MSRETSAFTNHPYDLKRVCRVWRVSRASVYRHRHPANDSRRPGPEGPCSDAELVLRIRAILVASPFHGEGYRKVWARLRFAGTRTSKARVLRLMRENGLLAPTRARRKRGPRTHDGTIITKRPNCMWGTDATATATLAEGNASVFIAVDHATFECVGIHASKQGNRFEALEPIRQGVRERYGAYDKNAAQGLMLRHDHGSQYMSKDFQKDIAFLGMESSPSFVRQPEGNGVAERFIRLLKENLLWIRTFETVEDLRQALIDFKTCYNEQWIVARLGYRTPKEARRHMTRHMPVAA